MADRISRETAVDQEWDEGYPLNAWVRATDRQAKPMDLWVAAVLDDLETRTEAAWRRRLRA